MAGSGDQWQGRDEQDDELLRVTRFRHERERRRADREKGEGGEHDASGHPEHEPGRDASRRASQHQPDQAHSVVRERQTERHMQNPCHR